MESLKHRLHYLPFEKFFPSEVRFQNGNGNGNGNGDLSGPSYGSDFSGYSFDLGADADGNLGQSAPEFTLSEPESEGRVQGVPYAGLSPAIGNLLDKALSYLGFAGPAGKIAGLVGKVGQDISGSTSGKTLGDWINSIFPSQTYAYEPVGKGATPSPTLSELSGFPSPGGGGEYPIQASVPIGALPLSNSSYVEPALVQAEIAALAKYISSPTEQSLTDVLSQAQFAYSSDQAKEEAQKETQSSQLASMLPIMGIILIGAFVAFRKGASA